MEMNFTLILDSLGWALLHSLWQGAFAFLLVASLRALFKNNTPSLRYAAQLSVLAACFAAFLATFGIYAKAGLQMSGENFVLKGIHSGQAILPDTSAPIGQTLSSSFSAIQSGLTADAASFTPMLGVFWCLGFAFLALRYTGAFAFTQGMRSRGLSAPNAAWTQRFRTLVLNAGLTADIQLYVSEYVSGPVTLGFIKPIVLVPAGFLTGLPQDQIEAILLHEIAHIHRCDYALNLVQTAIKTVLFFNPAIHYISRYIDIDREQACDDLAVAQSRNPQALAKGLASLRLQFCTESFAMQAAGNGESTPLLDRLSRLAGDSQSTRRSEPLFMSALTALLIGSLYLGASATAITYPETASQEKFGDEVIPDFEPQGDQQEDSSVQTHSQIEAMLERRVQDAQRTIEAVREQAFAASYRSRATHTHPTHSKKSCHLHTKLYEQLVEDGMIPSNEENVTIKYTNDTWAVNGIAVPQKSESKYCHLLASMGVLKAELTRIEVSPKSSYVISQSEKGPQSSAQPISQKITHGEFTRSVSAPTPNVAPVFITPTTSHKINQKFGVTNPVYKTQKHSGIDLGAKAGMPVFASRDGDVSFVTTEPSWGHRVILKHEDGYQTFYGHLNSFAVARGQKVSAGQMIGTVGSTGNTTGPHLHFEVRKDGTPVDPASLIF